MHDAVDFRGITLATPLGDVAPELVDDDLDALAHLAPEAADGDRALALHETMPALLLDVVGHGIAKVVGDRALDRLVAETTHAIELRLVQPVEEKGKILLGISEKPDD